MKCTTKNGTKRKEKMMKAEDAKKAYYLLQEIESLQCIAEDMGKGLRVYINGMYTSYTLGDGELYDAISGLLAKKKEELERL